MYEITFILKNEDSSSVKRILSKHGAEIKREEELKKIKTAYPLGKNDTGFLGVITFEADPLAVQNLFKEFKVEDNVIRYLITKVKEQRVETKIEGEKATPLPRLRLEQSPRGKDKRQGPVLTNEEIERKIEEILQ